MRQKKSATFGLRNYLSIKDLMGYSVTVAQLTLDQFV